METRGNRAQAQGRHFPVAVAASAREQVGLPLFTDGKGAAAVPYTGALEGSPNLKGVKTEVYVGKAPTDLAVYADAAAIVIESRSRQK